MSSMWCCGIYVVGVGTGATHKHRRSTVRLRRVHIMSIPATQRANGQIASFHNLCRVRVPSGDVKAIRWLLRSPSCRQKTEHARL